MCLLLSFQFVNSFVGNNTNKFTTRVYNFYIFIPKSYTSFFFFFVLKLPSSFKRVLLGRVFLNLSNMSTFHLVISFMDMNLIVSLFTHNFSEQKISHPVLLFPLIISINLSGFSNCFMALMEYTESNYELYSKYKNIISSVQRLNKII